MFFVGVALGEFFEESVGPDELYMVVELMFFMM